MVRGAPCRGAAALVARAGVRVAELVVRVGVRVAELVATPCVATAR
ncbi:hypothetical protein [Chondromyces apiculatus]|nr:hypothetical protein [Chondromyces apiculatus]